jgi:poly-D-alanine transfer protein DltD
LSKIKISSTDLIWIFQQRLSSLSRSSTPVSIAIMPNNGSWVAVTGARERKANPGQVKRIAQLQKQLREIYVLTKD